MEKDVLQLIDRYFYQPLLLIIFFKLLLGSVLQQDNPFLLGFFYLAEQIFGDTIRMGRHLDQTNNQFDFKHWFSEIIEGLTQSFRKNLGWDEINRWTRILFLFFLIHLIHFQVIYK